MPPSDRAIRERGWNGRNLRVVRYFGYLLIVLMALALAASVAVFLVGGLQERLAVPGTVRLVAFDEAGAVGGAPVRVEALCEDLDFGRPMYGFWLTVRFADGWSEPIWTPANGIAYGARRAGLVPGLHPYTVSFPETHPRLDVWAPGTIWVLPSEVPVLWVDAAALVHGAADVGGGAGKAPPEAVEEAVRAIKVLAAGRQVVYLTRTAPQAYASVRKGLEAISAPPGPAIWIDPNDQAKRLEALHGVWPKVAGALVAGTDLALAAETLGMPVVRVPPAVAGDEPRAAAWREALERLSPSKGSGKSSEEGK